MIPKLPRLVTGIAAVDGWIDQIVSAVEMCMNVTASGNVSVKVGPTGISFIGTALVTALAKSGGGGIAAMSGSTPGSASVTLYDFKTSTVVTQAVSVTAYNLSATAVGATKWLVLLKANDKWIVIWEDCG